MKAKNSSSSIGAALNEPFGNSMSKNDSMLPGETSLSECLSLSEGAIEDRAYDMDSLPDLLEKAEVFEESVYFYGATEELLRTITQKAKVEYPALKIAGFYVPPLKPISKEEDSIITKKINEAKPNLVFVSLGRHKQQRWIAEHKNKLTSRLLGLGRAFKTYATHEMPLHRWMRSLSLEWAYRLCLKPAKLWTKFRLMLLASYYVSSDAHNFG